MPNKIWVLGDAVVDLIPDGDMHYLKCAGGAPANVAVGVARLGVPSAFIGRVGKDPLGEFMQQTLRNEAVDTDYMYLDPDHRTSTVVVGLDKGERSFTFMVNPSADQFLSVSDLPEFKAGEWLHCCSIALINEPTRTATLTAMKNIRAAGGKDGALFNLNGHSEIVAGKALQPVDTTGAGDAFVGGLLAGLSLNDNWQTLDVLKQIIRQANACGALATTAKGAMSALPNQQQLKVFLAN